MRFSSASLRKSAKLSMVFYSAAAGLVSCSQAADPSTDKPASETVPLMLKLPPPAFKGTPKDIQTNAYTEPYPTKPRAPMMVPAGLKNLAPEAKLTSSDKNATGETLAKITDGDKEASDQSIIFLRKGSQYVQLDFGSPRELHAIVLWHAHN